MTRCDTALMSVHARLSRLGRETMYRGIFSIVRIAASVGAVALVTVAYRWFSPGNPTTIALSYVVVILLLATGWGIAEATTAARICPESCRKAFWRDAPAK